MPQARIIRRLPRFIPLSRESARAVVREREYIPRVYGASPAIVFIPPGPIASIRRCLTPDNPFSVIPPLEPQASTIRAKRENKGWLKLQAMQNGAVDFIPGYDSGECEPQSRGIH